ncbi:MAG TPA: hypothetical protein VK157_13115 [Phycisphaerales bacterium]|nr:hypothetical protein [Phycisphaerales bacterium]
MQDPRVPILILRWLSRSLLVLAWCAILIWITGRLVSDRFFWSQFLLWIPSWIIVPGSALCLALAAIIACFAYPRYETTDQRDKHWKDARPGKRTARWRTIAWLACGIVSLGMVLGEWRLFNIFTRSSPADATRLIIWNPSEIKRFPDVLNTLQGMRPDIALVANHPFNASYAPLAQAMGRSGSLSQPASAVVYGRLAVISKYPITRWAGVELDISGATVRRFTWSGGGMLSIDKGVALLVQLDTTAALGKPTVIWFIDLPSDPDIPRDRMMREARRKLDNMTNYLMRTPEGRDAADSWPDAATNPLRTPDIIAGDTNTPRGSHSLNLLNTFPQHMLTGAYEQAGFGPSLSYPRRIPLLAIDHTFLAPWLRATTYDTRDMGLGTHRLQEVELIAK